MPRYLLDTSVYSQPLRPLPHPMVVARWKVAGDTAMSVSAIALAELLYGLKLKNSPRLWQQYDALLKGRHPVVPFDENIAEHFAELKEYCVKSGRPIPDLDLQIAATAKRHGLIVATLNVRHFVDLPGVAVEDWTA